MLRRRQRGEGHDGKSSVGGRARLDECGGEGENCVDAEAGAVGVGGRDLVEGGALQGDVDGFGDEDGGCDGEDGFVGDEGAGAEVGRDTDTGKKVSDGTNCGTEEKRKAYPSSTDARLTKDAISVYGKLYSHAATGLAPVAAMASVKSLTCSSSSVTMNFKLLKNSEEKPASRNICSGKALMAPL